MLQLARTGTATASIDLDLPSDADIDVSRRLFAEHHCVKVPGFLSDEVFTQICAGIDASDFYERTHEGIGTESCLRIDSPMLALLTLLVNDERLFRTVEAITGCP